MAEVIFKRVANGFDVTVSGNTATVSMSDIPLTFANVGLGSQGYTQTQILQLVDGQEITVNTQ